MCVWGEQQEEDAGHCYPPLPAFLPGSRCLHHCCPAGGLRLTAAHTHAYLLGLTGNLWGLCSNLLSICSKKKKWRMEPKAASLNSHGGVVWEAACHARTHARMHKAAGATVIGGGGFWRRQRSLLSLPQTWVVSGLQPRRKSGQLKLPSPSHVWAEWAGGCSHLCIRAQRQKEGRRTEAGRCDLAPTFISVHPQLWLLAPHLPGTTEERFSFSGSGRIKAAF